MFNIGDKVRTLTAEDVTGIQLFPVGFIGVITDVDYEDEDYTYEVKENIAGSESWWYPEEGLELAENQKPLIEEVRDNAFANGSRYAYKIITQLTENNGQLIKNIFPNLAYSGIEALDYLLSKFSFETLEEKIKEYKEKTAIRVGDIITNKTLIVKNEIYVIYVDEKSGYFQGFNIFDGQHMGKYMDGYFRNDWEKIPDKHCDLKEVIKLIKGE
jgi:hypothetical protein